MLQSLVNGILLGGLYAIIGIGMSLVFGIMRLTNLAHGDLMILATYTTLTIVTSVTGNLWIAVAATILVMVALGFLIQNFLVNRVLDKGSEPALLVTFGVSIFISNFLLKVFGADNKIIQNSLASKNVISTEHLSISAMYLFSFLVGIAVILSLHYIMQKTYFGRSIRATSCDRMAAELNGVNTKRTFSYAMMVAMVTAAIAGVLVGSTFVFYPSSGTQYLIIAFGVVVIGGMGSLVGTLVGGIVLGVAQLMGGHIFGSAYQMLSGYIVLLLILAIRPNGLLSVGARK
ncbi:MAG: livH 3 [Bacillota bacterium]|jgi:branched-chain amino acid transport system permease protein|nr:livH 3 [Bacillota bacterium]